MSGFHKKLKRETIIQKKKQSRREKPNSKQKWRGHVNFLYRPAIRYRRSVGLREIELTTCWDSVSCVIWGISFFVIYLQIWIHSIILKFNNWLNSDWSNRLLLCYKTRSKLWLYSAYFFRIFHFYFFIYICQIAA